MKKLSQAMMYVAAVATTSVSSMAFAESPLTGNVGITSNYMWRGATQANDEAAVSGGIDYAHDSGFYAGTWVSSLGGDADTTDTDGSGQYEQDFYVGYSGKAGPVSYDVSYIMYTYPVGEKVYADFEEVVLNIGYGPVTVTLAPTVGKESDPTVTGAKYEDDMYMAVSAEFEVKKDLMLGLVYGVYDFDEAAGTTDSADYSHYQLSLTKGDFVFAYDVKDPDTADPTGVVDAPRFSVSWSKSFDL